MVFEPGLDDLDSEVRRRAQADTPLERVIAAVRLGEELGTLADATVGIFVQEARQAGHSWSEIGTALGVTKQAAQQRFSPAWLERVRERRRAGGPNMFEKFSTGARRLMRFAQEEARRFNHGYLGTEHLLLGLLRDPASFASQALSNFGVTLERVREEIETLICSGKSPSEEPLPFTPRGKKVIELAFREGLQLGHNYVGPEHILLGLIREGEGVAAQVLTKISGNTGAIRNELVQKGRSSGWEAGSEE